MRIDFYNSHRKPEAPSEAPSNLITKFFKRPVHKAHELRAQNDLVTSHIIDKWALATPKNKSIEKPGDNYLERKNNKEAQLMIERMESRKKKELEVARVLSLQCDRHKNEKAIVKV